MIPPRTACRLTTGGNAREKGAWIETMSVENVAAVQPRPAGERVVDCGGRRRIVKPGCVLFQAHFAERSVGCSRELNAAADQAVQANANAVGHDRIVPSFLKVDPSIVRSRGDPRASDFVGQRHVTCHPEMESAGLLYGVDGIDDVRFRGHRCRGRGPGAERQRCVARDRQGSVVIHSRVDRVKSIA